MMVRFLGAVCTAAVLMLPITGTSVAQSAETKAESTAIVATFGYAKNEKCNDCQTQKAKTGGLIVLHTEAEKAPGTSDTADADATGSFRSTASAGTSGGGGKKNGSSCGCGATASSEGSATSSASVGGSASNSVQ